MPYKLFFQEYSKNCKQTGSVLPSSRFLIRSMCQYIDFNQTITVLQLGAGTGVITRHLLKKLNSTSQLLCIEKNKKFVDFISQKIIDKRLHIINGSAEYMVQHLKNKHSVDYIISSLPLYNIPRPTKINIIRQCHEALKPSGCYIQYQYSLTDKKNIQKIFDHCSVSFQLLNFPPAFIYHCIKT